MFALHLGAGVCNWVWSVTERLVFIVIAGLINMRRWKSLRRYDVIDFFKVRLYHIYQFILI